MWRPIYNLWRRLFGRWSLDDPRIVAAEAPYTFQLPTAEEVASLAPGDLAKLIFRSHPRGLDWGAERMWVLVTGRNGDHLWGKLDNDPFDMPQLKAGSDIAFLDHQVISVQHADEEKAARFSEEQREWWDRCLVDHSVLNGDRPVGYLYREPPDMPDDKFPDSGWRIRSGEDEDEDETPAYVALGAVLNRDDSWIHLVDEPVGCVFQRNPETGVFEPVST